MALLSSIKVSNTWVSVSRLYSVPLVNAQNGHSYSNAYVIFLVRKYAKWFESNSASYCQNC